MFQAVNCIESTPAAAFDRLETVGESSEQSSENGSLVALGVGRMAAWACYSPARSWLIGTNPSNETRAGRRQEPADDTYNPGCRHTGRFIRRLCNSRLG